MFDIAVNSYNKPRDDVWKTFANSGLAAEFERGNPKIIAGLSGQELFNTMFNIGGKCTNNAIKI